MTKWVHNFYFYSISFFRLIDFKIIFDLMLNLDVFIYILCIFWSNLSHEYKILPQSPNSFQFSAWQSKFNDSLFKFDGESWKASQFTNAPTFLLHLKNWRVKLALSLTIWTGRKLGGPRQQIQTYDLGMKSDYLTIRPLWYCMLESRSRVSHLRLGFVLPLGNAPYQRHLLENISSKRFVYQLCSE